MTRLRHAVAVPGRPATLATVGRIVAQLRNDPRTLGLVLVVPALLLTLLYYVFVDAPTPPGAGRVFDTLGPVMLAVLPMMLMFIVTSVTMLRERTSGTLERILTTPLSRWNLLASYGLVFGVLAVAQSSILATLVLWPMGVDIEGGWQVLIVVALLDGLVGVAFGLLASAFARNEFQAVQFMPVFIGPQLFLCGLLVGADDMPDVLAAIGDWLPMTWAVDVVTHVLTEPSLGAGEWWRLGGLAALVLVALCVAAASMPRQTT